MTPNWLRPLALGLFACALPIATGCGNKPSPQRFYPVQGEVLCDGAPVAGAHVVFRTDESMPPPNMPCWPGGVTDAEGRFQLSTIRPNDGAPAGAYKVVVIWPGNSEGGGGEREGPDRLEGRYATPQTTPLAAEVKEGKNEPLTLIVK